MTGNADSYDEARKAAFQRDDHTCELCGTVGYPKTEHGLAAVPVRANDYRPESLVTVCHSCLKQDDQELREEVREAFHQRQRRSDTHHLSAQDPLSTSKTERLEKESVKTSEHFKSAIRTLRDKTSHLFSTGYGTERDDEFELVDQVGKRDNFHCQVCGSITQPRGHVGYIIYSVENQEGQPSVDNQLTVCMDCLDWEDERTIERGLRKSARIKFAEPTVSALYGKAVLSDLKEKARLFAHTGRLVILRRAIASAIGILSLLTTGVILAGILGALFVSPQSGLEWMQAIIDQYKTVGTFLVAASWLSFTAFGIGYLAHVFEQERVYERELFRDQRRRGDTPAISYARPRWQFVAGFAIVGLFGALDWMLVRHNVFPSGMLFGALVLWLVGATGVAYYLRYALREDRDVDGQPVNPAPWVFTARYALFVALVGGAATLLNTGVALLSISLDLAALTAPLVGLLYVGRRYAERRTSWGARLMQHVRTAIDRVWPWDDQWPPDSQHRQQTAATDSTSQRRNHDDSYE